METNGYKLVKDFDINVRELRLELIEGTSRLRQKPSWFWLVFSKWKKKFKELNPQISKLSKVERERIYTIYYNKFFHSI